jgi:hypothetical protein
LLWWDFVGTKDGTKRINKEHCKHFAVATLLWIGEFEPSYMILKDVWEANQSPFSRQYRS